MDYFTAAKQVIDAYQSRGITSNAARFTGIARSLLGESVPRRRGNGFRSRAHGDAAHCPAVLPERSRLLVGDLLADISCSPACSIFGPYAFFNSQFSYLAAQSSIARADYDSLQLTLRKRWSQGFQFDVNYTLSESKDHGSAVERGTIGLGGYSGILLNPFSPDLQYSSSDFDIRHQLNMNWVADLPFGRGRAIGGGAPAGSTR